MHLLMPEWLVGRLSDRFSLVILQKLKHVASVIAELFWYILASLLSKACITQSLRCLLSDPYGQCYGLYGGLTVETVWAV